MVKVASATDQSLKMIVEVTGLPSGTVLLKRREGRGKGREREVGEGLGIVCFPYE